MDRFNGRLRLDLPCYLAEKKGKGSSSSTIKSYEDGNVRVNLGSMGNRKRVNIAHIEVLLGPLKLEVFGAKDFYEDVRQILDETAEKTGKCWWKDNEETSRQLIECVADFAEPHLKFAHLMEIAEYMYERGLGHGRNELRESFRDLLSLEHVS